MSNRTEISTLGEFGLIDHLTQQFKISQPSTLKGIGDDAAVFRHAPDVLAGDGVGTERGVLVCAGGVVLFVYLRLA